MPHSYSGFVMNRQFSTYSYSHTDRKLFNTTVSLAVVQQRCNEACMRCNVVWKRRILLVHEVKALVWEQCSKALSQVVVGILCESHLLHSGQLAVARPDLLARWPQILQTAHAQVSRKHTVSARRNGYVIFPLWTKYSSNTDINQT